MENPIKAAVAANRWRYFTLPVAVLLIGSCPQQARALELAEAVNLALTRDAQFQADAETAEAIAADGVRALGSYGPSLSVTGAIRRSRDESRPEDAADQDDRLATFAEPQFTLSFEQPLIDLERGIVTLRGKKDMTRAKAEKKKAREELLLKVHERYFTALSSRENLELAHSEAEALQRQVENAASRLELGFGTITDRHNAEARYQASLAETIARRTDYEAALAALEEVIRQSLGPGDDLEDPAADEVTPVLSRDRAAWLERAQIANSDLALSALQAESARLDLRSAQSRFIPSLLIFADYSERRPDGGLLGYGEARSETDIGLRLNFDLLASGRDTAAVIAASHRYRAARHQVEAVRRQVERRVSTLWDSIIGTHALIDAYAKAAEANRLAMESTRAAYDEGVKVLLDLLNAQQDYYRSVREYRTTRYRYRILLEQFRRAVGVRAVLAPVETGDTTDRSQISRSVEIEINSTAHLNNLNKGV